MRALAVDTGLGAMEYGARLAGAEIVGCVEGNPDARAARKRWARRAKDLEVEDGVPRIAVTPEEAQGVERPELVFGRGPEVLDAYRSGCKAVWWCSESDDAVDRAIAWHGRLGARLTQIVTVDARHVGVPLALRSCHVVHRMDGWRPGRWRLGSGWPVGLPVAGWLRERLKGDPGPLGCGQIGGRGTGPQSRSGAVVEWSGMDAWVPALDASLPAVWTDWSRPVAPAEYAALVGLPQLAVEGLGPVDALRLVACGSADVAAWVYRSVVTGVVGPWTDMGGGVVVALDVTVDYGPRCPQEEARCESGRS